MIRPIRAGLTAFTLAACGGAKAADLAKAHIDTLPTGVVHVMSDGPTAWADSAGAGLVEAGRFRGEEGTLSELVDPGSIAVDAAGRIYLVDTKPTVIKVYTQDGKLVRTIGREGEGPGEFRIGFIAVRGEHLVLHDPRIGRTSVYDTAGNFIRSWHTSCCYWSDIQVDKQNRIYIPSMVAGKAGDTPRGTPYVRWTLEGSAVDTVWVPWRKEGKIWTVSVTSGGKGKAMMSTSVPFMPGIESALHPDGGFVYGWSGQYQIVRSSMGTDSVRVFGRSWTPDVVTGERRKGEVEGRIKQSAGSYGEDNVRKAFRLEDVPATLPAYSNLRVDPSGRTWARRWAVSDTTKSYYDAFDSTGAYLGPVTFSYRIPEYGKQVWLSDGLIAVIEDDEGRPVVVRFRFAGQP